MAGWSRRVRVEMQKCAVGQSPTAQSPGFVGYSTTDPLDDGSGVTEPTSTGGYARQAITWGAITAGSLGASVPATNSGSISWTSTLAWSTGASALNYLCFWNASSLASVAESAFCGYLDVDTPQAVNAADITLTIANGAVVMNCTPSA